MMTRACQRSRAPGGPKASASLLWSKTVPARHQLFAPRQARLPTDTPSCWAMLRGQPEPRFEAVLRSARGFRPDIPDRPVWGDIACQHQQAQGRLSHRARRGGSQGTLLHRLRKRRLGNPFHLASELFGQVAKIKLNHVPYRGAAPALQDLAAGQVGMMFVDFATARSQLATPGIKALAVASPSDFAGLPGVPTIAASGYSGFEAWAWQGFVAPAATPPEITTKLRNAYLAVIRDADITTKLTDAGIDVLQSTAAEFADYMRTEAAKWAAVIRAANIHAD
jgi:hypothetical protein